MGNVLSFVIGYIVDSYVYVLLLRFFLQYLGVSFYNPVSQLIVTLTNPLVKPLRRILPVKKGLEFSLLGWVLIIEVAKYYLLALVAGSGFYNFFAVLIASLGQGVHATINVFFWAIIIQAVMSWIGSPNPAIAEVLYQLTEPMLKYARRVLPPIAGFDLSPILVILVLQVLDMVLMQLIMGLAFSL